MGKSPEVLLAIEGGGSKGRAAIAWGGRVAARCLPAGLNPNDIDPDLLKQRLESLILPLLKLPGFSIGPLRALAAIAGAGRPATRRECSGVLTAILKPLTSRLQLRVTSDAEALLQHFFARCDGIVLIAGTGSICLGAKHAGKRRVRARAGGWGSYLDDGCGFKLGLGVLDAALKAVDGRGERTFVVDLLCRRHGLRLDQVPGRFLPMRREQVADLARVALEASSRGDPAARRLVRNTVADLVDMVRDVAVGLSLEKSFDLVVSGGLFENPRILGSFKRALKRRLPSASVIHVADPLACLIGRK